MFRKPSPVTEMLIREMRQVKELIEEVKVKMDNIDIEEELEKKKQSK